MLTTDAVFVAKDFEPLDFTEFLTTCVVVVASGGDNLGTQQANNVTNAAAISATAQAAATAATIATTLPLVFHSQNLPVDIQVGYNTFLNPPKIMINSDMKPFAMPAGGVAPVLSYLDPPIGTSVQPHATDSNHIIT